MGVMPRFSIVFDVRRRNCDTTLSFLRGFVDSAIFEEVGKAFLSLSFSNSGGQCSLSGQYKLEELQIQGRNGHTLP